MDQNDCNNADSSINPGATDVCGDGIDQDCSGEDLICPEDVDNDGEGYTENKGDCVDADPDIHTVIESGSYELPGGTRVEAGQFKANAVKSFASIKFSQCFNAIPVVITTINSAEQGDAVAMRLKNDNPAGGYLWDALQNTGYQEDYVNDRNGADPVEVRLEKKRENTVTVYLREDGTRLDRIELEPVTTVP